MDRRTRASYQVELRFDMGDLDAWYMCHYALAGQDLVSALHDFDKWLRQCIESDRAVSAQQVRDELWQILDNHEVAAVVDR